MEMKILPSQPSRANSAVQQPVHISPTVLRESLMKQTGRWSRRGRSPERSQGSSTEWRAGEDEQEMKRTQASKGAAGGRGCARCDRTVGLLAGSGDFLRLERRRA
ncbi:hypothetical protein TEQG_07941 [Trichophyton equinum CBS 127.97]|uniref:Uncharacterized protein n=1 Tax=Trichophyton equinum (strain ATCC MYA-4606 / CBS 127.97) TaxID=559882 RepID=F2Q4G1_TRIEC|nr:hypothetical protein TEQG_07941 [Trichophyton equinum CBS 127.97]